MDSIQHNILEQHYVVTKDERRLDSELYKTQAASPRVQLSEYQTTGNINKTAKYWSQQNVGWE
jgi:hypothetical protein